MEGGCISGVWVGGWLHFRDLGWRVAAFQGSGLEGGCILGIWVGGWLHFRGLGWRVAAFQGSGLEHRYYKPVVSMVAGVRVGGLWVGGVPLYISTLSKPAAQDI